MKFFTLYHKKNCKLNLKLLKNLKLNKMEVEYFDQKKSIVLFNNYKIDPIDKIKDSY